MHFNGANTHLFANGTEIIKLKAKDPDIVAPLLCLGNILKDFSVNNMKKDMFMILVLIMMLLQLMIY